MGNVSYEKKKKLSTNSKIFLQQDKLLILFSKNILSPLMHTLSALLTDMVLDGKRDPLSPKEETNGTKRDTQPHISNLPKYHY